MGRSEEVWGPDAWDFKPSRWIDTEGKLKKETQWVAHWFNGGYRLVRSRSPSSSLIVRFADSIHFYSASVGS